MQYLYTSKISTIQGSPSVSYSVIKFFRCYFLPRVVPPFKQIGKLQERIELKLRIQHSSSSWINIFTCVYEYSGNTNLYVCSHVCGWWTCTWRLESDVVSLSWMSLPSLLSQPIRLVCLTNLPGGFSTLRELVTALPTWKGRIQTPVLKPA